MSDADWHGSGDMALTAADAPELARTTDPSRSLAIIAIPLVALVLVTEATTHLVDYGVYDLRVRAMNANLGSSPVAWVSPAALAIALASAIVLARRQRVRPLLAGVLGLILVLSTRHLGESLPFWQLLLLPPLGLGLALLWQAAAKLDPLAGRICRVGCGLLVVAFTLHVFGGPGLHQLGVHDHSWPYQIKIAFKEGFEITGWLLVASGLAATACGYMRGSRRDARAVFQASG
jgi:hypothetical protein